MMFWVNQELLKQAGLDEIKDTGDFDILQKSLKNSDQYAYGDAWENTHVYNSLAQFVNFWGGDYFDWTDSKTQDAARYMKSMLDEKITSPAQFVDQYEQMEEKFTVHYKDIKTYFYMYNDFIPQRTEPAGSAPGYSPGR